MTTNGMYGRYADSNFATPFACSMNSFARGPGVRFFRVNGDRILRRGNFDRQNFQFRAPGPELGDKVRQNANELAGCDQGRGQLNGQCGNRGPRRPESVGSENS